MIKNNLPFLSDHIFISEYVMIHGQASVVMGHKGPIERRLKVKMSDLLSREPTDYRADAPATSHLSDLHPACAGRPMATLRKARRQVLHAS